MAGKVDLKVVLLGKEYGGKTSLVERYIHGKFNSNAPYQSVSTGVNRVAVWVGPGLSALYHFVASYLVIYMYQCILVYIKIILYCLYRL